MPASMRIIRLARDVRDLMRRRTASRAVLVLAALLLAAGPRASAQQYPIFGCRHAVSCRVPPVGPAALNDPGTGGLLALASVKWGPGFQFGLLPNLKPRPEPEAEPSMDGHAFHLRNVRLLPPPEKPADELAPTPAPPPASVTPAPSGQ
jgi:hypothetical protein